MGTGGPRALGHRHPPWLTATVFPGHPTWQRAAPAGSGCVQVERDPTCRKAPGEKSQGFLSGRSWWGESQAWRGLDYIFVALG